jgi:3-hydroxyacyl-CoA dehydrogenase
LKNADWIAEVVIENIDIKKNLFEKVEQYRKPGSLITSNTSGKIFRSIFAVCTFLMLPVTCN